MKMQQEAFNVRIKGKMWKWQSLLLTSWEIWKLGEETICCAKANFKFKANFRRHPSGICIFERGKSKRDCSKVCAKNQSIFITHFLGTLNFMVCVSAVHTPLRRYITLQPHIEICTKSITHFCAFFCAFFWIQMFLKKYFLEFWLFSVNYWVFSWLYMAIGK